MRRVKEDGEEHLYGEDQEQVQPGEAADHPDMVVVVVVLVVVVVVAAEENQDLVGVVAVEETEALEENQDLPVQRHVEPLHQEVRRGLHVLHNAVVWVLTN